MSLALVTAIPRKKNLFGSFKTKFNLQNFEYNLILRLVTRVTHLSTMGKLVRCNHAIIAWKSTMDKTVVLSTTEAAVSKLGAKP